MSGDDRTQAIAVEWLETVEAQGVNLSKWETSFIESLRDQVNRGGTLSQKQIDLIERIYTERTP